MHPQSVGRAPATSPHPRPGTARRSVLIRWTGAFLAACLVAGPAARAAELRPGAPESYTVRPADTLWSISGRFLRDPWRWREVWRANTDVSDPDLIYPGDVLRLTMVDGQPRIGVDRGGETVVGYRGGMRVVRLGPKVRSSLLKGAIPTIPIAYIAPFLTQPYVAQSDQIKRASYVVGFPDEHLVAGVGDSVYVRRIDTVKPDRFQILRPGEALRDPKTNETLGYLATFVASAALERTGDPAKMKVLRMEREVGVGDRVIPASQDEPLRNFFPRPAPRGLRPEILAVLNGVTQVGQFDVVIINAGTRERVESGHVFEVFQGGTKETDLVRQGGGDWDSWKEETPLSTSFWYGDNQEIRRWRHDGAVPPTVDVRPNRSTYIRPFERSGLLMVFRVFERVSFAIVLEAKRAMHVHDRIAPPPI
ncbi:LysM peptidoglycan-binding domain-containing protein [uncultured Thiodictyon sp.]|uniref:LysM peptidoglycan-binding domain-containing protein n=1 Tax=uncultured Thiodictyon sp. TaxID=1846217 RepID=UPI0025CFE1E7|nr:LysM domain-containing protein [uncultured Thiodictyon sp.]